MTMQKLTNQIVEWAENKRLDVANPDKQMLKLGEEYGELCSGMAKANENEIVDAIGDMYVVLTILSLQLDMSIEECVSAAYEEIKDRTGEMKNGVFVKSSDL